MRAERAFFSFTHIASPADHRAYNEWHQLDHRPENLALPGVLGGERWVRTPRSAAAGRACGDLERLHYLNMYWFDSLATIARWEELAETTFQAGRRADVHLATRLLMGHFRPISTWVAPRIRLAPDALRHRPNRGVHLIVTTVESPRTPAAERRNAWWDATYIPAQLRRPGVAGCWSFAGESNFAVHADLASGEAPMVSTRIVLFCLDEDAVDVSATFDAIDASPGETVSFAGPLEAITPWRWDWFEGGQP
jgi:hypothetical protein